MLSTDTLLAKQEAHSTHTQTCIHSFITSIYIAPLQVGLLKGVHTYIHIHEKHTRLQHSGKARGTYIHPCTHIRTHTTTYTRRYTHTNTYKRRFTHIQTHIHAHASIQTLMNRAHSFPRKNLTNPAVKLVNSADHHGKANEIPRLTAAAQLNTAD